MWQFLHTVQISKTARGWDAGFTGEADVYAYIGDGIEGLKNLAYGAVARIEVGEGYHCTTHVTNALKKADRRIRPCRSSGAAHEFVDWGAPIGQPSKNINVYVFTDGSGR